MNTIPNYSTASKNALKVNAAALAHLIVQNDQCGGTGNLTILPGAGRPAWTACSAQSLYFFENKGMNQDSSVTFAVETVNRNGNQTEKITHEWDAPIFVLENIGMTVELDKTSGHHRDAMVDYDIKVTDSHYCEGLVFGDLRATTYDF